MRIRVVLGVALTCAGALRPARAADLRPGTIAAFERYVQLTEARMDGETGGTVPFLWVDRLPEAERREAFARLQRGEIAVSRMETRDADRPVRIPDGMSHHWVGTVFAPGASLDRVVTLMQSYDTYQDIYKPAVRRSRTIGREGDHFTVYLQLFMKKVISVVLNTEYQVDYIKVAPRRMHVRSYATRIAEVREPGTPQEQEKPVGQDNGFLWRFNNYCSLDERESGTYVQCESVSLSRSIPTGLGWLVGPFVTGIPRESLEFTLGTIRTSMLKDR